jgi:hypothetical protein
MIKVAHYYYSGKIIPVKMALDQGNYFAKFDFILLRGCGFNIAREDMQNDILKRYTAPVDLIP